MSTQGGDTAAAAAAPDTGSDFHTQDLLGLGDDTLSQTVPSVAEAKASGHDRIESGSSSIYHDAPDVGESSYALPHEMGTRSQHDSGTEEGGVKSKGKEARNAQTEEGEALDADVPSVPGASSAEHPDIEPLHQLSWQEKPNHSNAHYYQIQAGESAASSVADTYRTDSGSSTAAQKSTTRMPSFGAQGNTEEDRRNWERIQALGDPSGSRYTLTIGEADNFPEYPTQRASRLAQKRKQRSSKDSRDLDGTPSNASAQRPGCLRPPYDETISSAGRSAPRASLLSPSQARQPAVQQSRSEVVVPRWQPDAAVTLCPICGTQFSFFVRKHHCRKCGRVVCNACSPHRITIPYQFIVQPPTEIYTSNAHSSRLRPTLDPAPAGSSSEFANLGGGERVRLCNPCVPDPNTAPPQTPAFEIQPQIIPRSPHSRAASSANHVLAASPPPPLSSSNPSERMIYGHPFRPRPKEPSILGGPNGALYSTDPRVVSNTRPDISISGYPGQDYADYRTRSSTVTGGAVGPEQNPTRPIISGPPARTSAHLSPSGVSAGIRSPARADHHTRPLPRIPRRPRIAEEDECPVCHQELSPAHLPNSEALRAAHITNCIEAAMQGQAAPAAPSTPSPPQPTSLSPQAHDLYPPSSSSVPRNPTPTPLANTPEARMTAREQAHAAVVLGGQRSPAFRRTGVFPYKATEKDCVDDAECTICLEEFEVGQEMGRLECFCRFHLRCIREWFVGHYGQCPVHHQAY